ncbi:MAG: hypothetical protein QM820_35880 [Minicystis sp.]
MRSPALLVIALAGCTSEHPVVRPGTTANPQPPGIATTDAGDSAPPSTTAPTPPASKSAAPPPRADWMAGLPVFEGMLPPETPSTLPGVTAFAVKGELDKLATAWLERAKREGVRFLGEHRGYSWRTFSFELPSRERGNLTLQVRHKSDMIDGALGGARHPPRPLAGACVPVPRTQRIVRVRSGGVDQRGEMRQGEVNHGVETTFFWDLDGDGQLDALAPHQGADNECPWQVEYEAYLMRGSCGHDVGRVGPGYLDAPVGSARSGGPDPEPLKFTSSWSHMGEKGIPVHVTRTVSFAFDGARYQKTSDEKSEGICHHCSAWINCNVMR